MRISVPSDTLNVALAVATEILKRQGVESPKKDAPQALSALTKTLAQGGMARIHEGMEDTSYEVDDQLIKETLGKVSTTHERVQEGLSSPLVQKPSSPSLAASMKKGPPPMDPMDPSLSLLIDAPPKPQAPAKKESPLTTLGVSLPNEGKYAEQYAPYLEALHDALVTYRDAPTTPAVVADGLKGPALKKILEQCAQSVHVYVAPCIKGKGEAETCVFETSERARHMASRMADNYLKNITLGCERVGADMGDLRKAFGLTEDSKLVDIHSTGSDFHKGGKQVLILTFDSNGVKTKVVYKPSDVETDSLVVSKDKTSLASTLNALLPGDFHLPTYTVVPKNPGSAHGKDLAVRESYGYIEFLESPEREETEQGVVKMENNPHTTLSPQELVTYLHQSGAWLAAAVSFGIKDLHSGNVMAHDKRPYVIDLEFGFHGHLRTLEDTSLLTKSVETAGILGTKELDMQLDRQSVPKPSNSSIALDDGKAIALSEHMALPLYEGYLEGMFAIRKNVGTFVDLLGTPQVQGSVGRYDVFNTGKLFDEGMTRLWGKRELHKPLPESAELSTTFASFGLLTDLQRKANTLEHTWQDFMNGDLPAFYHRASSREVVDSHGKPIEGFLLAEPTVSATVRGLRDLAKPKEFVNRTLAHLTEISAACKDEVAPRTVRVGGMTFTKPANSTKWSAA